MMPSSSTAAAAAAAGSLLSTVRSISTEFSNADPRLTVEPVVACAVPWICEVCRSRNSANARLCAKCLIRKGVSSRITSNDLCVLHATTMANAEGILARGFEISATPIAGRSAGDAIYAYSYGGGDIKRSVSHAVSACEAKKDRLSGRSVPDHLWNRFAILQLKFDFEYAELCVFDLAEWFRLRNEETLSNFEAAKCVCGDLIANTAQQILAAEIAVRKANGLQTTHPDNVDVAHLTEAARQLGFQAFYGLPDGLMTFFDPREIAVEQIWLGDGVPEFPNSEEKMAPIMALYNEMSAELFARFVNKDSRAQSANF